MPPGKNHNIPLAVVGYDFRRASTTWRSMLVMKREEQDELERRLEDAGMVTGVTILNTCNRNELIASAAEPQWVGEILRAQMVKRLKKLSGEKVVPEPFSYAGIDAARHMVRVAVGLESFVIGERQIVSQINNALTQSRERNQSSVILNGLGSAIGRAARESSKMDIGGGGLRGVHDAAIRFLQRGFDSSHKHTVVVVGTGDIGRLVIQGLRARTKWRVLAVNRTPGTLGNETVHPLESLPQLMAEAQMMLVCTGALEPLIGPEILAGLPDEHPLTVLDLGIPIQVDPDCRQIPGVELLDLDRLQETGVANVVDPYMLEQLEGLVEEIVREFERFCMERDMVRLLETTQRQHEHYVHEVIPSFIESELPELSPDMQNRLAFRMRAMIREYTNQIFESIHKTTMEKTNG